MPEHHFGIPKHDKPSGRVYIEVSPQKLIEAVKSNKDDDEKLAKLGITPGLEVLFEQGLVSQLEKSFAKQISEGLEVDLSPEENVFPAEPNSEE